MDDLRPCPRCHQDSRVWATHNDSWLFKRTSYECLECGFKVSRRTAEKAVEVWNEAKTLEEACDVLLTEIAKAWRLDKIVDWLAKWIRSGR